MLLISFPNETTLPLADIGSTFLGFLMAALSVFLILLILIQRGRGGGLTGALGGPGGQSAFGSKAGDTFTFVTIIVASVWALVCALTMLLYGVKPPTIAGDLDSTMTSGPGDTSLDDLTKQLGLPPTDSAGSLGNDNASNDVELVPAESATDAEVEEMLDIGVEAPAVESTPEAEVETAATPPEPAKPPASEADSGAAPAEPETKP